MIIALTSIKIICLGSTKNNIYKGELNLATGMGNTATICVHNT